MFGNFLVRTLVLWVVLVVLVMKANAAAERFFYLNNGAVLQGCVYKPVGDGPFPAVVFLQNVTKPLAVDGPLNPFPELGKFYTDNGYVLLVPGRQKVLLPSGKENDLKSTEGTPEHYRLMLERYDFEAETLFASIVALKAQSYIATDRIFCTGIGAGAIVTLLLAEKEVGLSGCVLFSPPPEGWKSNPQLRAAMRRAVTDAKSPLFLIQPQNDVGLGPSEVLGKLLLDKGRPNKSKVFPPFGNDSKDAHYFAMSGSEVWGSDVLSFFSDAVSASKRP
jgi:dienelactone hydrolase